MKKDQYITVTKNANKSNLPVKTKIQKHRNNNLKAACWF